MQKLLGIICTVLMASLVAVAGATAEVASTPAAASEPQLFAVEIKVGPKWDPAKSPQEQAFFREHSTNLRRLRDAGVLVMDARYADKGLVVPVLVAERTLKRPSLEAS